MKRAKKIAELKLSFAIVMCTTFVAPGYCQTMFTALQSNRSLADKAYGNGNFHEASDRYEKVYKKDRSKDVLVRLARCRYFLHHHALAVNAFEKYTTTFGELPVADKYFFAESYASLGQYEKAISLYQSILTQTPDDMLVAKKVWRLTNIQYLYEDSLHYAIQPLNINSPANEFGAVPCKEGIVFVSDREYPQFIEHLDAATEKPFYSLYFSDFVRDTLGADAGHYGKPKRIARDKNIKFQEGTVSFFNQGKRMVYTTSSEKPNGTGRRTLQFYFAEWKNDQWITSYAFPYNSPEYSVTDPAISEDGSVLYFASDMRGGQGGKDLYRSEYSNGQWSRPVNLIDLNTRYDEAFPFLHHNHVLYFSSTGHAGMGGLDIFKTDIIDIGFTEISNLGYPINTRYDDFSFVLDSLGIVGHLASNRDGQSRGDDVYRVDIDMQSYPLAIEGVIRYKEIGWRDSTSLKPLANARLVLIDNLKGAPVNETLSDASGNFTLNIPYFSQYKIKVVEGNKNESIVSLEVPRHRKKDVKYEMVVVRDVFKN